MRVLHIDASPRENRSRSRPVAERFLSALPDGCTVNRYDLWDMDLPSLGGDMIEGRYALLFGQEVDPSISQSWEEVRGFAEAFLDHDAFVVSTPMWNFGIPYQLKHFVDVVTQPGMTFRNDAQGNVEGLAAGKRALIVAASAMPFGKDPAIAALDHQLGYLEAWLGFIGIERPDQIRVAPTFGPDDTVADAVRDAEARADALAHEWGQGF